jgi:hypothetical protein
MEVVALIALAIFLDVLLFPRPLPHVRSGRPG